jgi:hypothetical protein
VGIHEVRGDTVFPVNGDILDRSIRMSVGIPRVISSFEEVEEDEVLPGIVGAE